MTFEKPHALGLCLIPLKPGPGRDDKEAKTPDWSVLPNGEWKPYQKRRPTEAELKAWFGNGVRRNAAVVLGKVSGVVVIESDTPEAEAWCAANLPPTPMATRSGRGVHRYYRIPTGVWADEPLPKKIGPHNVEVKGHDQLATLPGSLHYSGHVYAEVEPWPDTLEAVPEFPWAEIARLDLGKVGSTNTTAPPLPTEVGEGNRNNSLFLEGCRLRRLGYDEGEIAAMLKVLNHTRFKPPIPEREVEGIARSCAKYEPAADTYPLTEVGDAEFFASLNAGHVVYDHRVGGGRSHAGWMRFEQHHWRDDADGHLGRLAVDAVRGRQAAATKVKDDDKRKLHLQWATKGEDRRRQTNLLALAQNVAQLADAGDNWDKDPYVLGVANGVVNLRTGQLRDGLPEDRITRVSPVAFDANAPTDAWAKFVLDICADDAELAAYWQVVVGYSLTGLTSEQCFWILYGTGSNGKSTLLETLTKELLPEHSWTMAFPSNKSGSWTGALSEYQRAALVGRRLVVASETETAARLNTEFMKSLTGDETVNARHPYGRPFEFRPEAKFFLAVNHKPEIHDESHGMWRRVRLVPFDRTFPPNPTFAKQLVANKAGILRWAVEGAVRYFRDGMVTPKSVLAATAEYQSESDSLAPFFEARCHFAPRHRTNATELYRAYQRWAGEQGEQVLSQKAFGTRLGGDSRLKKDTDSKTNTVVYLGVALIDFSRREEM